MLYYEDVAEGFEESQMFAIDAYLTSLLVMIRVMCSRTNIEIMINSSPANSEAKKNGMMRRPLAASTHN